jgi:outer membrane receptor protein involved in Fe transport
MVSATALAVADQARTVNVRAGDLVEGLESLAKQCGVDVIYPSNQLRGLKTAGVSGTLEPKEAFKKLIEGTPLTIKEEGGAVLITLPTSQAPNSSSTPTAAVRDQQKEGKSNSSTLFLVAQANSGQVAGAAALEQQARSGSGQRAVQLEEVVVTAQKREERLQDVPASVTAVPAESLVNSNQLRLQDYYSSIPGLSLVSNGSGSNTLSIRGITTGGQASPTVGIVVDDVPFGVSTALTYRVAAPDIDPSELARIEVLSGPQGTLYGASSMGGLVKFVTVDPSTDAVSGRVAAGTSSVYNGAELGYTFRGAVNLPLSDTFALRASAFTRRDPGYIDGQYLGTPPLKLDGINETRVDGGRLSALWKFSPEWSLRLSALYQYTDANGTSVVTLPPLGDLVQQLYVRGAYGYTDEIQSYTANLSGAIGPIKIVSITGYNSDHFHQPLDLTSYPFVSAESQTLYGVTGALVDEKRLTEKFTQEIRLTSSWADRLDWLLGLFYTHENTPTHDIYQSNDSTTLAVVGLLYDDPYPTTYTEYAVFGDVTFHLTDRFDLQLGGRESQNRQSYSETLSGPAIPDFYGLPSPLVNPPVHTKDNAFTYLVTPSYKWSPDLMAYARVASGYRPGGPNPTCILFAIPCHFNPDKTVNYELGMKGELFDHRLSLQAAAYYIHWNDIQLQVYNIEQTASFFTNASTAKSQGLELSVQARPTSGLQLSAWVAWNDAQLTADMPPGGLLAGNSGDPLPYSSRFSGNVSGEQDFPISGNLSGFAGAQVSYVGARHSDFTAAPDLPRLELPSYVLANIRAGVRWESWTVTAFLNNVADERGEISGGTVPQTTVVYIQPRTVGLLLVKQF